MKNAGLIRKQRTEGLRVLLEALISCGVSMSIAGSSRPCSGSEHLFSHALETVKPNSSMHGERCGVGTILMAYVHGVNWRRIRETLKAVGAPTNAYELGLTREDVVNAFFRASSIRPERYTILNKLNLSFEECEKIAKMTDVI
jgi:glycerol-1-phosphate dehydrogenase [NAD(P)+]